MGGDVRSAGPAVMQPQTTPTKVQEIECIILRILFPSLRIAAPNDEHVADRNARVADPWAWYLASSFYQADANRSGCKDLVVHGRQSAAASSRHPGGAGNHVEVILDLLVYQTSEEVQVTCTGLSERVDGVSVAWEGRRGECARRRRTLAGGRS